MKTAYYLSVLNIFISSCTLDQTNTEIPSDGVDVVKRETISKDTVDIEDTVLFVVPESGFITMQNYAEGFVYDMKYATEDNFLKKKVYNCEECWLRKEVADALIKTNKIFIERGCRIKFFDCYRPLDVQKIMWKIYPDARYVANPHASGSIHNRGGAVDITLVDMKGNELDMGTTFDHFGKEAHHSYTELSNTVLDNRKLLKTIMEANGFSSISYEWWHYNHKNARQYKLSNFQTECK